MGRLRWRYRALGATDQVDVARIPILADGYRLLPVEEMAIGGDAPKDFLVFGRPEEPSSAFIAKAPRKCGPRECMTEEIISTIGRALPLKVAGSKLVRLRAGPGADLEVRFLSRYFLRPGEQLVHGAELLAMWLGASQAEVTDTFLTGKGRRAAREERMLYSVDLIHDVLMETCGARGAHVAQSFARMMAYDALVGAMDRHAMNWGVVRSLVGDRPMTFAPIFDTARGLFWHHLDHDLARGLADAPETYIRRYADKCTPLFGAQHDPRGAQLNHFEMIRYALTKIGEPFSGPIHSLVRAFRPDDIEHLLRAKFGRMCSGIRLDAICLLLRHRHQRLKVICEESKKR